MSGIPQRESDLSGGPAALAPAAYLDFLSKEYLASYVGRGGAAVKLMVVNGPDAAREMADGLATLGDGFEHAAVDAASTRVHMIDQVFAAAARQLDWVAFAGAAVRAAYEQAGFPVPPEAGTGGSDGAPHGRQHGGLSRAGRRRALPQRAAGA